MTADGPPLFDSHAHLDDFDREGIVDELLARARAAGVTRVAAIGGGPEANARAARLAAAHPDAVCATAGFDRDLAGADLDWAALEALAATPAVRAIGETGLDYHYSPDTAAAQRALFERQLELSARLGRPVVVHSREADEDTVALLRAHRAAWAGAPAFPGVLHCFTGTPAFAARLLELGYLISFSGIVTFKNARAVAEAARLVPDDRLLLETDAPYLAPVPLRGRRNEPAFVIHVAAALDTLRGQAPGATARNTFCNACRFFGINALQP